MKQRLLRFTFYRFLLNNLITISNTPREINEMGFSICKYHSMQRALYTTHLCWQRTINDKLERRKSGNYKLCVLYFSLIPNITGKLFVLFFIVLNSFLKVINKLLKLN